MPGGRGPGRLPGGRIAGNFAPVRSIKAECLDRMIFLGEASLRRAIENYIAHYHGERKHQGLGNQLIDSSELHPAGRGPVCCRERLGGLLRFYHQEAASASFGFWYSTGTSPSGPTERSTNTFDLAAGAAKLPACS